MTTAHAWQDHPILPRKAHLPFSPALPRYWMGGSRPLTHLVNGLNLLFPKGERFFIRSVRAFMDEARDNPALYEQLRGFMAQEVRHGIEHERFFEILQGQGFDLDAFLDRYDHLAYHRIEPASSPRLRLAATAALEHFTAIFGDFALVTGLPEAHPELRELLLWHAAEEIEHKCVAFDLLQLVDDSYLLRVEGLAVAILVLGGFWAMATLELSAQDRQLPPPERSDAPRAEARGAVVRRLWRQGVPQRLTRGFFDYLRRDFHPSQHDNLDMARSWLAAREAPSSP